MPSSHNILRTSVMAPSLAGSCPSLECLGLARASPKSDILNSQFRVTKMFPACREHRQAERRAWLYLAHGSSTDTLVLRQLSPKDGLLHNLLSYPPSLHHHDRIAETSLLRSLQPQRPEHYCLSSYLSPGFKSRWMMPFRCK